MLSEKIKNSILECQKLYPEKRSALIPALHMAQTQEGYLPHEIQVEVAELFGIDTNEVHAIVTFYDMFYEKPVGKHIIHVCKNVSCMLRGCDELLDKLCHKLQIAPGETTADGEFTVIPSECLGACDRAPMMLVDKTVIGPVAENDLDTILEVAKSGPSHPSPVEILENSHG
jgi:NADH-quinone oxidoreductase subunit E